MKDPFLVYENSSVVLNKLKSKYFHGSSMSTSDFARLIHHCRRS